MWNSLNVEQSPSATVQDSWRRSEMGQLTNMRALGLLDCNCNCNSLSGSIPTESQLTVLTYLGLNNNNLTGYLPILGDRCLLVTIS
jgi:Leucine-rich repeat (LRR) protein